MRVARIGARRPSHLGAGVLVATLVIARASSQTGPKDGRLVFDGEQQFTAACGYCHGPAARGGSRGPSLIRSLVVLNDEKGAQLGPFLRVGRPDQGMPRFDRLTEAQIGAIAAFLKSRVDYSATKGQLRDEAILGGDAVAGRAFFNAAGGCTACHSGTGDLRGIGSKYPVVGLQERLVMPHRDSLRSKRRATVSLATGETISGVLLRLTDFDVSIRDESGWTRSFLRQQGVPRVSVIDPLQAHVDRLPKWRDAEIHNVTAYLAGLK